MDPITALGLAASIVNVIGVIAKSVGVLRILQIKWTNADRSLHALIGQLSTLRVALDQIRIWLSLNIAYVSEQLVEELHISVKCCQDLILLLSSHISSLEYDESDSLTFLGRARAFLDDGGVKESIGFLDSQSIALNLLLSALNCQSLSEQRVLLERERSKDVLKRVRDNSSSLLCLKDGNSSTAMQRSSFSTDKSSLLSRVFEFDDELQASPVYRRNVKSLVRRALRGERESRQLASNIPPSDNWSIEVTRKVARPRENSSPPRIYKRLASSPSQAIQLAHQRFHNGYSHAENTSLEQVTPALLSTDTVDLGSQVPRVSSRPEVGILVHGLPGSGATTLLERIGLFHEAGNYGLGLADRERWRRIIISHIAKDLLLLVSRIKQTEKIESHLQTIARELPKAIRGLPTADFTSAMVALAGDEAVKDCCQREQWDDYYFSSTERIVSFEYTPTDQDIIHCSIKRDREIKVIFDCQPVTFRFFRPPGTTLQREKFVSTETPLIILVMDISAHYIGAEANAQPSDTFSDEVKTLLQNPAVACIPHASIILLLNKNDLYQQKQTFSPLDPRYCVGYDFCATTAHLHASVEAIRKDIKQKLYPLWVCALNEKFPSLVKDVILDELKRRVSLTGDASQAAFPQNESVEHWTASLVQSTSICS